MCLKYIAFVFIKAVVAINNVKRVIVPDIAYFWDRGSYFIPLSSTNLPTSGILPSVATKFLVFRPTSFIVRHGIA